MFLEIFTKAKTFEYLQYLKQKQSKCNVKLWVTFFYMLKVIPKNLNKYGEHNSNEAQW